MGELRVNLTNFITVGLMALVFVFIANKLLALSGIGKTVAGITGDA